MPQRFARLLFACVVTLLLGIICCNLIKRSRQDNALGRHAAVEQLEVAAQTGDTHAISRLLQSGVNVNAITGLHSSVLSTALRFNHFEAAKLLIDNGANVKTSQLGTWPPLVDAAASCSQAVPLLIEKGAPVNKANIRGETPLLAALQNPAGKDIVPILLARGADLNAKTNDGDTVLMRAVRTRDLSLVKMLLRMGAECNAQTKGGKTALMLTDDPTVIRALIQYKADPNRKDIQGHTPLFYAFQRNNLPCALELVKGGANSDERLDSGRTLLEEAIYLEDSDLVTAMRKHGVD